MENDTHEVKTLIFNRKNGLVKHVWIAIGRKFLCSLVTLPKLMWLNDYLKCTDLKSFGYRHRRLIKFLFGLSFEVAI